MSSVEDVRSPQTLSDRIACVERDVRAMQADLLAINRKLTVLGIVAMALITGRELPWGAVAHAIGW